MQSNTTQLSWHTLTRTAALHRQKGAVSPTLRKSIRRQYRQVVTFPTTIRWEIQTFRPTMRISQRTTTQILWTLRTMNWKRYLLPTVPSKNDLELTTQVQRWKRERRRAS